ncbi:MAG: hydrogenase [Deltaproteobacteria bacterium CG2_30_63_29]|nr:MAG: hydrogenase [Deltaproteobacteria bacterium CG2_30_63_29]PJB35578.1 MAG: hydrogenase [Deltaproteobacteria bacterium CG_4_9_14_3_um_filter_63_12]
MNEFLLIAAIVLAGLAGVPGLFRAREGHAAERLFVGVITLAGVLAGTGAIGTLAFGSSGALTAAWPVPGGQLAVEVDAISAMFVLQIAVLAVLSAWYGLEYWPQKAHPTNGRKLRAFYGVATAAMLLLVIARNAVLFLVAWEVMALAAFFLFTTEDEKPKVREVGFVYLLAARGGTLCLFAMFALLAAASGTLSMDGWPLALASPLGNAIFIVGLCGFGLKAGIMPLHIWLPGAHANAPSHISALMSGVLIKMGIYGIVRLTASCALPPLWWGYVLIGLGAMSGVLGVGFAIGQHDIKRLLAYHSVENIGIICLGLGVAVLGRSLGRPELVALGIAGALLHVWNHGLFKALLFLSAGSVVHATGTREIDRLGGLWRRMPRTGLAFLVGAVAICGLPPLNGLISELMIYLGLFQTSSEGGGTWLAGALAAPALAIVGALAVACFVKVFGAVFLGEARTVDVEHAHDPGRAMLVPMAVLALACLFIALGAPLVSHVLDTAVTAWAGGSVGTTAPLNALAPLVWVSATSAALLLSLLFLGVRLGAYMSRREFKKEVGTWDCGYAAPTARMQYTSSSFAATLVGLLAWALRPDTHAPHLQGAFPATSTFASHVPDTVLDRGLRPVFSVAARVFMWLRFVQSGNIHLYLLYILGTLVVLLLWR